MKIENPIAELAEKNGSEFRTFNHYGPNKFGSFL